MIVVGAVQLSDIDVYRIESVCPGILPDSGFRTGMIVAIFKAREVSMRDLGDLHFD